MSNKNIIEINGKRYDANSGRPLEPVKKSTSPAVKAKAAPKSKQKTMHDVVRPKPKHAVAHRREHSKTLMRHVVSKPSSSLKRRIKAQGHTGTLVKKPAAIVSPKASVAIVDERRLKQAKDIPKSHLVSHFGAVGTSSEYQLPVTSKSSLVQLPSVLPTQPNTSDMLQHALEKASSHRHPAPKRTARHSRLLKIGGLSTAALSVLVLLGFAVSNNLPGAQLHIASNKAGFAASLPSYKASGYRLGSVESGPGVVAINYQSNSDDRKYVLTEKTSSWDSAALLDSFVKTTGQQYQTIESAGRTIYIYGQHDATWVSGGIWYQVHTEGALSDRQLIDLASSL